MRRLPPLLAVLVAAVLAAGIVGVGIHSKSSPSNVAAPTTEAPTLPTEVPSTTPTTLFPTTTLFSTTVAPLIAAGSTGRTTTRTGRRGRTTTGLAARTIARRTVGAQQPTLPMTGPSGPPAGLLAVILAGVALVARRLVRVRP